VVVAGARVQMIRDGFKGSEGPIALPDGSLIFAETQANRIVKIDAAGAVSTFLENTNGSNGLAFDAKGRLITVQTVPGRTRVGIVYPAGSEATLVDGVPGRPNDLTVSRAGGIYYTLPGPSVPPGEEPPPGPFPAAIFFVPPGGTATKVAGEIAFPNGILLSRDEKTLYVNDTQGEYMLAFDVQANGTLTNRRDFAQYKGVTRNEMTGAATSGADGLAIDTEGRLYAATAAGVQVFSPKGEHLGTIPVPRAPQNLAFAGPDKKTLYIVGRGAAFKVAMIAQGYKGRAK
jgi:gluconolactonase